jgi:predicted nucleotidyltransferase
MPSDPERFAAGIRRRNERERRQIAARHLEAFAEARRLADRIAARDPGVVRIYVFGSVAQGTVRSLDFDIDLAVEGGDVDVAMDVASTSAFPVDVVDLDRAPEHLRRSVLERGSLLLQRKPDGTVHRPEADEHQA